MKVEDERFAHLTKDPRFKKVGKEKKKVKIDNRFKHMFTAPEFSSVDFLDQRGRKDKQVTKEKLEKFYEMSSEDEEEDDTVDKEGENDMQPGDTLLESSDIYKTEKSKEILKLPPQTNSEDESSSGEEEDDEEEEQSDSSDGESTDEEEVPADEAIDAWDEVNVCTEIISESTPRLSICNLNWDRMNATDIFVLCSGSLPESPGSLLKVEVFPSQFGKEQLAKELEKGPDVGSTKKGEDDENDDKEYSNETLRKYQIERLKYCYAIVTCDSATSADALYRELDGVEYQLSSSVLDLRFVPDDMEFDEDPATSACTSMPDMTTYKPPHFITTALQNSSVKLTWDETDQSRLQLTTKKFSAADLETVDFSAYIASSESESEGEEAEEGEGKTRSLEKYKALLAGLDEEEGREGEIDQEMEITWTTGLEENNQVVEEADKNEKRQEHATLYEPDEKDDFFATDTVIDRPKPKRKKKKNRDGNAELTKEETELALLMESEKDDKKHFDMKKIVKSGKGGDFKVNIEDDRFSAIKTSHHFAIDPSVPEYRDTSETQKLRATQVSSLAGTDNRHAAAQSRKKGGDLEKSGESEGKEYTDSTENPVIDKIKNRAKLLQTKKENSKIYKTKNKGVVVAKETELEHNLSRNAKDSLKIKKKKRKQEIESVPETSKKAKKSKKEKLKHIGS